MNCTNKLKKLVCLLFFFLFYTSSSFAQKIEWDSIYSLPFKQDSVESFNTAEVQNHTIYPILQSTANIEIRLYLFYNVSTQGKIWTLKIFGDTVIAETYNFMLYRWRYVDAYEFLGKDIFGQDIGRRITRNKVQLDAKTILDSLIKSKIFETEDYTKFLQNAKTNKVAVNKTIGDCLHCIPTYIEIKFNNKIRNFYLPPEPEEYMNANRNIEYFRNTTFFLKLIASIFR